MAIGRDGAGRNWDGPANAAIARLLGIAIATGELPSGTVLPGEIELASRHGVSRSVIREAMRTLAAKRLVESRQKSGTRVRQRSEWNLLDPDLLGWMFEGTPPVEFVRNLFQLRMMLEAATAEAAAGSRTARQLSLMGHALETMALHGLHDERGRAADQQFHTVLLEATGNDLVVSLSSTIASAVRWTTLFKYKAKRPPRDPLQQHRVLFEAIADGDGSAAREAAADLIQQALLDTEAALV